MTDRSAVRSPPSAVADVGVVIVAAGTGSRTGSPELKQFRWLAGKPMLLHSVQTFLARPDVAMVVCVLPKSHAGDPPPWLFQLDTDRLLVSVGGRERGESVLAGLEDLPEEVSIVLVHDAARPFVYDEIIDDLIAEARKGVGVLPGQAITDTLKEVNVEGYVTSTVDRKLFYRAQTPQAFPRAVIEQAYIEARKRGRFDTDDAALVEAAGHAVVMLKGSDRLMKITYEHDFAIAEAVWKRIQSGEAAVGPEGLPGRGNAGP